MRVIFNLINTAIIIFLFSTNIYGLGNVTLSKDNAQTVYMNFYNEKIQVAYDDGILISSSPEINESAIKDYYSKMESTPYQSLLQNLTQYQKKFRLNDWLFYELVRTTLNKIYVDKSDAHKELTSWFLLSKAGYNTRITYLGHYIFVYVQTDENIFETPLIEVNQKTFINLSSIHNNIDTKGTLLNMIPFAPNKNGKQFSFDLSQLPLFQPIEKNRKLMFQWRGNKYVVDITFDRNLVMVMENYPIFEEAKYIQTPLSSSAIKSIIPQLRKILKNKTEKEAIEILAAFTRSSFRYKDDYDYFGRNKPMIGDEVFYYPYSDCEDRSALFYALVKELLQLPMIVIAYDDHLTIAVATHASIGNAISYRNKKYYICDPTGPNNSVEIGKAPKGYENRHFDILAN